MTADDYGVSMTDAEIAAFLESRGHGVLSFAGPTAYAIPVSFGFDPDGPRFVFQFLWHADSDKREFLTDGDRATLTAYEFVDPDDWRSVVAGGRLSPIPEDSAAAVEAATRFAPHAATVSLTVFDAPAEELDAGWYALQVEDLSGRHSG